MLMFLDKMGKSNQVFRRPTEGGGLLSLGHVHLTESKITEGNVSVVVKKEIFGLHITIFAREIIAQNEKLAGSTLQKEAQTGK